MTLAQQRRLKTRFPLFFRELSLAPERQPRRGSPLGDRGIECGSGWYALVAQVARTIEAQIARLPKGARGRGAHALQVKEKLGTLRVYVSSSSTDGMRAAAFDVRERSMHICEDCGRPGKMRNKAGWWTTLCAAHARRRRHEADAELEAHRLKLLEGARAANRARETKMRDRLMTLVTLIEERPLYRETLFVENVGAGWVAVLDGLADAIERLPPVDCLATRIVRVKEKYGALDILGGGCMAADVAIEHAEEESAHVCETCGADAETHDDGNGRLITRCDDHQSAAL